VKNNSWFSQISFKQRIWFFATIASMIMLIGLGIFLDSSINVRKPINFNIDMSIKEIAPQLGVTGKSLARELELSLDVSKKKPIRSLGVKSDKFDHSIKHILSHRDATLKYYIYAALVIFGLVFLVRLGRPDNSSIQNRRYWYPRMPYLVALLSSVTIAGFFLGKSPNPMEGAVKVFKSMVGLYPDPAVKVLALLFFIGLAVIGNKMICGWACPFGALQELIYNVPVLKNFKHKKPHFILSNIIRATLFVFALLFLFGIIGGNEGFVIYHYINPFNLFNFDFESLSILLIVSLSIAISFFVYRPFCQFICPFGLISWIFERFSVFRVSVDKNKCVRCGACLKACPLGAAQGIIDGRNFPPDCFSCGRCLNVCPVDAIKYSFVFEKAITKRIG